MNKRYSLIMLILICGDCVGQNLVPNGDFESYSSCPSWVSQLDSALFWMNPSNNDTGGSPDYYNECSTSSFVDVPNNNYSFQIAHSGVAYAGIYVRSSDPQPANIREYIEVSLTDKLREGDCYLFQMYVNLADLCKNTTYEIGAYFSDSVIMGIPNYYPIPFLPQINNSVDNSFDSQNWTLVEGTYHAKGGESYLIIGNFKNDSSTAISASGTGTREDFIYVYIDDVSLSPISCSTGLNEILTNSLHVFPNPTASELTVLVDNAAPSEFILVDITSRKLRQQTFTKTISINMEDLAIGLYIYEVKNSNGTTWKGKVVKE